MSKENLLVELRTYELVDQYLFDTERALVAIKYVESIEVKLSVPYRTSSHCVDIYKSKGDTTMSEITQQNLYLLLPFKVSWVADMLAEDEHISTIEAIRRVYSSAMYKQLEQESTKRWHEGPVSLYQTI